MNLRYRIDENGEKVLQQQTHFPQHNDNWADVPTVGEKNFSGGDMSLYHCTICDQCRDSDKTEGKYYGDSHY